MLPDTNIFSCIIIDAKTSSSKTCTMQVSEETVINPKSVGFILTLPPSLKNSYNRNVMESRSEDVRVVSPIWNELRYGSGDFGIWAGWYQSRWRLTYGLALHTANRRQCAWQCYSERRRNGCTDKWQTRCVKTFSFEYRPVSCVLRFILTLV